MLLALAGFQRGGRKRADKQREIIWQGWKNRQNKTEKLFGTPRKEFGVEKLTHNTLKVRRTKTETLSDSKSRRW